MGSIVMDWFICRENAEISSYELLRTIHYRNDKVASG